jgi:23S rRNA (cytosine1962-C5)-methyltransferase
MGRESYPLRVPPDDYELLDVGDGRRLERFGPMILDRPAPGATEPRRDAARWRDTDLRFDPSDGWAGRADASAAWTVRVAGLTMELRPTSSGGVGLYPEHAANLAWLADRVRERAAAPAVLNLFAHTGLATLAAARAGAAVAHVDGARASVQWARRNAGLNDLAGAPIRWLVDDAVAFVEREARRGRRYDGLVLDPPSFGRAGPRRWSLRDDLPQLLAACGRVAADGAFVLLTAHATGVDGGVLDDALAAAIPGARGRREALRLDVAAASGAVLALGWAIRLEGP